MLVLYAMTDRLYGRVKEFGTRLLCLHPGTYNDALVLDLFPVSFQSSTADATRSALYCESNGQRVTYEALSYCWGGSSRTQQILLNDETITITPNLEEALRDIRDQLTRTYIWIDDLCINQGDSDERSWQVQLMYDIYSSANHVLVWLGKEGPNTSRALKYISGVAKEKYADFTLDEQDAKQLIEGLDDLNSRPWFQRVWVLQEVFAARSLMIQCGDCRIWADHLWEGGNWSQTNCIEGADAAVYASLHRFASTFAMLAPVRKANPRTASHEEENWLRYIMESSNPLLIAADKPVELVNIICLASGRQCTDPRDYIFGLLAMSNAQTNPPHFDTGFRSGIQLDYNVSAHNVFGNAAAYIMTRDNVLNVLCLAAKFGGSVGGQRLASWVPDWRTVTSKRYWLDYCTMVSRLAGQHCQSAEPFKFVDSTTGAVIPIHVPMFEKHYPLDQPVTLRLRGFQLARIVAKEDNRMKKAVKLQKWLDQIDRAGASGELRKELRPPEELMQFTQEPLFASTCPSMSLHVVAAENEAFHNVDVAYVQRLAASYYVTDEEMILLGNTWEESHHAMDSWIKRAPFGCEHEPWLVPSVAREDDVLVIVEGALLPLILRRHSADESLLEFIGPAILMPALETSKGSLSTLAGIQFRHFVLDTALIMGSQRHVLETFDVR